MQSNGPTRDAVSLARAGWKSELVRIYMQHTAIHTATHTATHATTHTATHTVTHAATHVEQRTHT